MPRQKSQLANGEIYHICLRAVGDTVIFLDESDHFRAIFSIYEFNNGNSVTIWKRRRDRLTEKKKEVLSGINSGGVGDLTFLDRRDKIVDILAFCFMPNHIHLVVKQVKDSGISKFMQKVGGGLASYFNGKYGRKGHLFNQFKAIHIANDDQLRTVINYVHCNPISLIEPGWKENGIKDPVQVINFLNEAYRWSSYFDYIGKQNFTTVTSRDFILDVMSGPTGIKIAVEGWIKYRSRTSDFDLSVLEN